MNQNRRGFLKLLGIGATAAGAVTVLAKEVTALEPITLVKPPVPSVEQLPPVEPLTPRLGEYAIQQRPDWSKRYDQPNSEYSNNLLSPKVIAARALFILQRELRDRGVKTLAMHDYPSTPGYTWNVRKPAKFTPRWDPNYRYEDMFDNVVPVFDNVVPVPLDYLVGMDLLIDQMDCTLDIDTFSRRFIGPSMVGIARDIAAKAEGRTVVFGRLHNPVGTEWAEEVSTTEGPSVRLIRGLDLRSLEYLTRFDVLCGFFDNGEPRIKEGSFVRLKSGGPLMRVDKLDYTRDIAECHWATGLDGERASAPFRPICLSLIRA
jgi:uncharacterized protein YodC (DUF2158 family)